MGEISGVPTSDINNVDGFFTTQGGGGGLQPTALGQTGTYIFGGVAPLSNSSITSEFLRSVTTTHSFTTLAARGYNSTTNFLVLGIKSDGTLWYFRNSTQWSGGLSVTNAWAQFGTDNDWEDIACGYGHYVAVKGGDLYGAGYSSYRAHGIAASTTANFWTLANNSEDWSKVAAGRDHSLALTTDGKLFSAGRNRDYMTALGTQSGNAVSFTQIGTDTDWATCGCGYNRSGMSKTGGGLYFSGYNSPSLVTSTTSTADVNGPVLAKASITPEIISFHRYGGWCLDGGQVLFAGYGSSNARFDNSFNNMVGASSWGTLTGAMGTATDFTFVTAFSETQLSGYYQSAAIKNGKALVCGTAVDTALQAGNTGTFGSGDARELNPTKTCTAIGFAMTNIVIASFT